MTKRLVNFKCPVSLTDNTVSVDIDENLEVQTRCGCGLTFNLSLYWNGEYVEVLEAEETEY